MNDELITEVNQNDDILGLRPRQDFYDNPNLIHRSSYLLLFDQNKRVLLQKRAKTKRWHSNVYTYSVAETVGNETYKEAVEKGMEEELGISIPIEKLFKFKHFDGIDKAFKILFVAMKSDEEIKTDQAEAQLHIWMLLTDIKQNMENHPEKFAPPFVTGMKIFFEKEYDKKLSRFKYTRYCVS